MDMTGIAIGTKRATGAIGRAAAAVLLVLAGVAAGIGIAQVAGLGGSAIHSTTLTTDLLAADDGWQAFRAGERDASLQLSGDTGYQEFRAGERQP
jgi:hypothetical protein